MLRWGASKRKAAKHQPRQLWIKRVIAEMGGKDAIVVDEAEHGISAVHDREGEDEVEAEGKGGGGDRRSGPPPFRPTVGH